MRTILHLVFLAVGFAGGIFVGVRYPQQAANIDQVRAEEQAKIMPKIQAEVAKAKIEILNRVLSTPPQAAAPTANGGTTPAAGDQRAQLQQELDQAKQHLNQAQGQLNGAPQ